jgi:alpha-galactosidase
LILKFDLKAGPAAGTTGEIAVQVGDAFTWCQGSRWTWTNANSTRTIAQKFADLGCPAGVHVDPAGIRAIWLFLDGGQVVIDNVRAE